MSVEKAAAYCILGIVSIGALGLLFMVALSNLNISIFLLAGLSTLFFSYYYWNYWR